MILAILAGPATAQPPASVRGEPRLPGAVIEVPDWLKDAPFDIAEFFAMPPDAENAAPLYLDAFFEFGSEVAHCFPPDKRVRTAVVKDRFDRFMVVYDAWSKDTKSVPAERIDAILAEFEEGLRKLDLAQRRPRCVFAMGLTFDSPASHAQVARNAVRVLRLEAAQALDRGEFRRAIDDIGKMFRISRDLRPRAPLICQLVSVAIDATACLGSLSAFLAHPRIRVEHCDGLLRVLAEHKSRAIEPFKTGVKGEYALIRSTFRSIQQGFRTTLDSESRPVETKLDRAGTARRLAELLQEVGQGETPPNAADLQKLDDPAYLERVATWVDKFAREADEERRSADEFARSLLDANSNYAIRLQVLEGLEAAVLRKESPSLFKLICPDGRMMVLSSARDDVYLGAAECLIAVRRWQLTHAGATPTDLAEACRAAGLPGVPLDPFSGSSLKLAVVDGEPVIYSVGDDGRDDGGLKDADLGRKPGTDGDYLFRLKVGK